MATWRLIREEFRPAALQMALDEVALRAARRGTATVRVYGWEPSALSLGYAQDPATVDWAAARRAGVDVVRRRTGGGAIYHDRRGDVSYSIAAPADALPDGPRAAYRACCTPVFDALDRVGVDARFAEGDTPPCHEPACYLRGHNGAHDVVAGDPPRKVGGNAQYRTRGATLQHGSVAYATDPERHRSFFSDPPPAAALEERVTAVRAAAGVDREAVVAALETALREWAGAEPGGWTDAELAAARELAGTRYRDPRWTRSGEDPVDGEIAVE